MSDEAKKLQSNTQSNTKQYSSQTFSINYKTFKSDISYKIVCHNNKTIFSNKIVLVNYKIVHLLVYNLHFTQFSTEQKWFQASVTLNSHMHQ